MDPALKNFLEAMEKSLKESIKDEKSASIERHEELVRKLEAHAARTEELAVAADLAAAPNPGVIHGPQGLCVDTTPGGTSSVAREPLAVASDAPINTIAMVPASCSTECVAQAIPASTILPSVSVSSSSPATCATNSVVFTELAPNNDDIEHGDSLDDSSINSIIFTADIHNDTTSSTATADTITGIVHDASSGGIDKVPATCLMKGRDQLTDATSQATSPIDATTPWLFLSATPSQHSKPRPIPWPSFADWPGRMHLTKPRPTLQGTPRIFFVVEVMHGFPYGIPWISPLPMLPCEHQISCSLPVVDILMLRKFVEHGSGPAHTESSLRKENTTDTNSSSKNLSKDISSAANFTERESNSPKSQKVQNASYWSGHFVTSGQMQVTTACSTWQLFLSASSPILIKVKFLEWTRAPYDILLYALESSGAKLIGMLHEFEHRWSYMQNLQLLVLTWASEQEALSSGTSGTNLQSFVIFPGGVHLPEPRPPLQGTSGEFSVVVPVMHHFLDCQSWVVPLPICLQYELDDREENVTCMQHNDREDQFNSLGGSLNVSDLFLKKPCAESKEAIVSGMISRGATVFKLWHIPWFCLIFLELTSEEPYRLALFQWEMAWQPNEEYFDVSTAVQFSILGVKHLLVGTTGLLVFIELWVTRFVFRYFQWHLAWALPICVPSKVSQCVLAGVSPQECSLVSHYCHGNIFEGVHRHVAEITSVQLMLFKLLQRRPYLELPIGICLCELQLPRRGIDGTAPRSVFSIMHHFQLQYHTVPYAYAAYMSLYSSSFVTASEELF